MSIVFFAVFTGEIVEQRRKEIAQRNSRGSTSDEMPQSWAFREGQRLKSHARLVPSEPRSVINRPGVPKVIWLSYAAMAGSSGMA